MKTRKPRKRNRCGGGRVAEQGRPVVRATRANAFWRRYAEFGPFRSSPSSRERESDQVQAVIVTAVLSAADRDPVVGAGPSCAAPNPRRAGTARPLAPAHIVLPDPRSKPTASLQRHERKFGLRPKTIFDSGVTEAGQPGRGALCRRHEVSRWRRAGARRSGPAGSRSGWPRRRWSRPGPATGRRRSLPSHLDIDARDRLAAAVALDQAATLTTGSDWAEPMSARSMQYSSLMLSISFLRW